MTVIQKYARIDPDNKLGARQIRVIASDATSDRVGDVMEPMGCDASNYRKNPIVLIQHDQNHPVGTAQIDINSKRVAALIEFAPAGVSAMADEWCGLCKAGVISGVSVGFSPLESEPIKGGGWLYRKWELLELSVVSVPANPAAVVVERSASKARKAKPQQSLPKLQRVDGSFFKGFLQVRRANPGLSGPWTDVRYAGDTPYDAWLKAEWPGLPWVGAHAKERDRDAMLMTKEWRALRSRKQQFRDDWLRAYRERVIRKLEQPTTLQQQRSSPGSGLPYFWDPNLDVATNSSRKLIHDFAGRGYRP